MKKYWIYFKYVVRHKYFVFLAGRELGVGIWQLLIHDWSKFRPSEFIPYARFFYGQPEAGDEIKVNLAKTPYSNLYVRMRIIGKNRQTLQYEVIPLEGTHQDPFWISDSFIPGLHEIKMGFKVAWNAHQKRNPHHWQYWVLMNDDGTRLFLEMPDKYLREMLADWIGAGRAITGKNDPMEVVHWYYKNRDRISLHYASRDKIHRLLEDRVGVREFIEADPERELIEDIEQLVKEELEAKERDDMKFETIQKVNHEPKTGGVPSS